MARARSSLRGTPDRVFSPTFLSIALGLPMSPPLSPYSCRRFYLITAGFILLEFALGDRNDVFLTSRRRLPFSRMVSFRERLDRMVRRTSPIEQGFASLRARLGIPPWTIG